MRKKLAILSASSFGLAQGFFLLSFWMYHYLMPDGSISPVFRQKPGKPFLTLLWAILGVMFLFSSIMSLLIAAIFGSKKR